MTGDVTAHIARVESLVTAAIGELGTIGVPTDLARTLVVEALGLIADDPATLDLKIATAALAEMRDAFAMFAPHRSRPKVTIFGSARTQAHEPVYEQTRRVAHQVKHVGQFGKAGTDGLESPVIFNTPEVRKAGGKDGPIKALRELGKPADVLLDTKSRLFAA